MKTIKNNNRKQKGVSAIITALCLVVLLGIAAVSVDIATYFLRNNELQNAADAGSLAGARVLYDTVNNVVNASGFVNENGSFIPSANQVAHNTAEVNVAQNVAVEVDWESGNTGDVRRGHWSFSTRTFTPSDATEPINILHYTTEELDIYNPDAPFINAIEVTTRRRATPLLSFFARIFGITSLEMKTKAIAYLGFAGELLPLEADLPITLCEDTLLINGVYECSIGRMINSGSQTATNDTGRWTDFRDTDQCSDSSGVNTGDVTDAISPQDNCESGGNPETISFGTWLATGNGEITPAITDIKYCFDNRGEGNGIYHMWLVTLPVVDCSHGPNCGQIVGMASVAIAWVNSNQNLKYKNVPKFMYGPMDDQGNPITDEYGNPYFENWPGEYPPDPDPSAASYENVNKSDLAPFIETLYTYYESDQYNAFKNLASDLDKLYPDPPFTGGWDVHHLFEDDNVDIIDPNTGAILINEEEVDGKARWASFIQYFSLQNIDVDPYTGETITKPAPWRKSSIYFLPSCDVHIPTGASGGKNFGILAKVPVLVD